MPLHRLIILVVSLLNGTLGLQAAEARYGSRDWRVYGGNFAGTITDGGHNIDDGTTCGFTGAGCATPTGTSFCNTNPQLDLAGLASNGGPTQTIALEAGSPAINAGDETVCAAPPVNNLDQRGVVRPGAGATNCSIGAYEFNAVRCGDVNGDGVVKSGMRSS